MSLLEQLENNKGTISSAISKQIAKEVLEGDVFYMKEAAKLIHYDTKNVRSGAAKIIELVAEQKPELVVPFLEDLQSALDYEEPQTKWMLIHIFGLCARLSPVHAQEIFDTAVRFLHPECGTVLRDRAITYLGYVGALSKKNCDQCFPLLIESFSKHPDRITRIFESLERMYIRFDEEQKKTVWDYALKYKNFGQASIQKKAKNMLKLLR